MTSPDSRTTVRIELSAEAQRYETLRSANPDFAEIHSTGYDTAKRMATDGLFDACGRCGHERQAHFDGDNCGEPVCPSNCVRFRKTAVR